MAAWLRYNRGLPGAENVMRCVEDLLRENLKAFGERDREKWLTVISTIGDSESVLVDPDGPHVGAGAIDKCY